MKRMLLLLVLVLLAGYSIAQCRLGLRASAGFTTVAITNLPSEFESIYNYRLTYQGGVTFGSDLSKKWKLNTELLYALKGADIDEAGDAATIKINFHYLSLPLLLDYQLLPKFYLGIGPELSYRVGLNTSEGAFPESIKTVWDEKWDFGLNAAIKFYATDQLYTSLRYTHGFTNLSSAPFTSSNDAGEPTEIIIKHQNRALQLSLGYEFSFKKK